MSDSLKADLCVIGAGSAGLSIAAGASQMGARVVLIEKGKMGGDCLNYGCVPSKSLLVAAKAAASPRHAGEVGVRLAAPGIDFTAVMTHVHGVIAAIAPNDSQARFEGMGVSVLRGAARFIARDEVEVAGTRVKARRIVIATGSKPLVPPIPGLQEVPFLTNETVFDLEHCPRHLIVVGGGPIGCELGQAFRRLGAEVTLVELATLLPKDDPELVELLRQRLLGEGIALLEGTRVAAVASPGEEKIAVTLERDGRREVIEGSHLLLAAGRATAFEGLDLEAGGVAWDRKGLLLDRRLRSRSNKRVYAAGDAAGGPQFTHVAGYHASIVLKNALFRLPAKAEASAIPWVTYTDPELAHVGLTEAMARAQGERFEVLRSSFHENDRAQAEHRTSGLVKVLVTARGKLLGASIVGANAGELIQPWVLALSQGLKIAAMATMIAPYPTLGEASKRAAGSFYAPKLFSERTRKLVRFLGRFG